METLWWRCVWGHVFPALAVPDGGQMQCPVMDDEEQCATYFLYLPFASEEQARHGATGTGESKWAPWARGERAGS
jgi:hypothetical protein